MTSTTKNSSASVDEHENPCGIEGLAFVEFSAGVADGLSELFNELGFSGIKRHRNAAVELFRQGESRLLVNSQPDSFAARYHAAHGPTICAVAFKVADAKLAFRVALERGAQAHTPEAGSVPFDLPAVYGIGGALIYFIEQTERWFAHEFADHPEPTLVAPRGLSSIDHITQNVHRGTLVRSTEFYKSVFGFREVRSFVIRGELTGLRSCALRSPDGSFCVPINEGTEDSSQIEEYLRQHEGPGIQHIALLTEDLLGCLDALKGGAVRFLDTDKAYYADVFDRVPGVKEDPKRLEAHGVLVDGDEGGYLLQIFTRSIIGPMFFEVIQRENHSSFGEGNFGGLFRSIEGDQARRGSL